MSANFGFPKECKICGKSFVAEYSEREYCSTECSLKGLLASDTTEFLVVKTTCIHCGTQYTPYTSKQKFCSSKCRLIHNKKVRAKEYKCPVCNKIFNEEVRCNAQKYCSPKCRNIRRNIRRRNKEI